MKSASGRFLPAILLLGASALAGSAGAATFTVTVAPSGTFTFSPSSLTINVGDTVNWVWEAPGHTTTSGNPCTADGTWDSGLQNNPFTFSFTFNTAGTYPYFCSVHCNFGMTGEIIVQEPTATPTSAVATVIPTPTPTTAGAPSSTPTSAAPPATATLGPSGAVVTLSPPMLLVLGLALAGAALLLLKRS